MPRNFWGEWKEESIFEGTTRGGLPLPIEDTSFSTDGSDLGDIFVNGHGLCRFPEGVARMAVRTMSIQGPKVELLGPNEAAVALSGGSQLIGPIAVYHQVK